MLREAAIALDEKAVQAVAANKRYFMVDRRWGAGFKRELGGR